MSPRPVRRFRVALTTWGAWSTIIDAPDRRTAEDLATALWDAEGERAFTYRDGGVDGVMAEDLDEEAGS